MPDATLPPGDSAPDLGEAGGPYVHRSRADWAELANALPSPLSEETLDRLRGLGDPTSMRDVVEVYQPLTRLLSLHFRHRGNLYRSTNTFLRLDVKRTPFVIGIAGSVAVGKSTTARLLTELLRNWPDHPNVELVTTDGFLYPNEELKRRGIMHRKGFPESYDRRALLRFVMDVKSGRPAVTAPVYSHLSYDIVPGERLVVRQPDIVVVEGLNVLQPARVHADGSTGLALSDFFDFSVYVDAAAEDIRSWYLERFMSLRETAFRDPRSYFRRYAEMSLEGAMRQAANIWDTINGPNLALNIRPTRGRATAILRKGVNHEVKWVRIRKI
ncbi:type I pantothenate kinase [Raineyella sp. W15-4]|uniref:type I pantothenate kinase n=1 Tax=Raineyella sp. W15-4 TaxID=3081651 RepID=UPI0029530797|nr:type I pantothenate kinase [Raineyella sp. W15-4]WOQ17782.1 type I pantothenate kinase [Raineyella sp. W15-4]